MITKTLLPITVLAASMVASNVYADSYDKLTPVGFSFQSNPFDAVGGNAANNVIANVGSQGGTYSGPWDSSAIQVWSGLHWTVYYFDSETTDTTTGFVDANGTPLVAPVLVPGLGYLIDNAQGVSQYIDYQGSDRTSFSQTYSASLEAYRVGSPHLLSGGLCSAGIMANSGAQGGTYSGPFDNGCSVSFLEVNSSGLPIGWTTPVYFDSETTDTTTGFIDVNLHPVPEPQISYAEGYFFYAPNGATWTQP